MLASEVTGEVCLRCGGREWVVEVDGGAGTARPCECRGQGEVPRLLEAAGIPPRYRGCKLENFDINLLGASPQIKQAVEVARSYTADFIAEEGFRESGLLFVGPPGTGKTHLAAAVLAELIRRYRVRGRFVDFTSLIHQIQATFDAGSQESKREILDPVMEAEVLVLDELGAQKPTPWVRDILYLIINTRYSWRRPTIFTTNYRLDPAAGPGPLLDRGPDADPTGFELLSTRIPPMLVSRLHEMAKQVLLTAAGDFRRVYKAAQHHIEP